MKLIALVAIYLLSFVLIYMMMSLVGLMFSDLSYVQILRTNNWTIMYSILFGWWLSGMSAREYYVHHQEYFNRVFN
jgi:hypothetical protein